MIYETGLICFLKSAIIVLQSCGSAQAASRPLSSRFQSCRPNFWLPEVQRELEAGLEIVYAALSNYQRTRDAVRPGGRTQRDSRDEGAYIPTTAEIAKTFGPHGWEKSLCRNGRRSGPAR